MDDDKAVVNFLERCGDPNLALQLPGLSLETLVDTCMRHGFNDRLEEVIVELYGVQGIRAVEFGSGLSSKWSSGGEGSCSFWL